MTESMEITTFGAAAGKALAQAAPGAASQTKPWLHCNDHKRAFARMWRRWSVIFRYRDSRDELSEKLLMAEYYRALGHLSADGFDALTELLSEKTTFFPSIAECVEAIHGDQYDWGHPFRKRGGTYARPGLTFCADDYPALSGAKVLEIAAA